VVTQRFQIIFDKVAEAQSPTNESAVIVSVELSPLELDEILELGRLAALVAETEPTSFTST
jgi:hypothetical protein